MRAACRVGVGVRGKRESVCGARGGEATVEGSTVVSRETVRSGRDGGARGNVGVRVRAAAVATGVTRCGRVCTCQRDAGLAVARAVLRGIIDAAARMPTRTTAAMTAPRSMSREADRVGRGGGNVAGEPVSQRSLVRSRRRVD